MAAPIVGEKIMGMRLACRSFQAAIRRSPGHRSRGALQPLFVGSVPTLILQLAAIEAHVQMVATTER